MPSEMHFFIKKKLGRSSSKLVQSFARYLQETHGLGYRPDIWESSYPYWIKTVKLKRPTAETSLPALDLERLYRTIARQSEELVACKKREKEKDETIKQLQATVKKLENGAVRYIAPPPNVQRAMAEFGD